MGIFSKFRKQSFLSEDEIKSITDSIAEQEKNTSGEIRLYLEKNCRFINPVDRASELFQKLKMYETQDRNAILIYIAYKDRQIAIWGDDGIHSKLGTEYWNEKVKSIIGNFNAGKFSTGICNMITDLGNALCEYFPYDQDSDKNELPNDIVFG